MCVGARLQTLNLPKILHIYIFIIKFNLIYGIFRKKKLGNRPACKQKFIKYNLNIKCSCNLAAF